MSRNIQTPGAPEQTPELEVEVPNPPIDTQTDTPTSDEQSTTGPITISIEQFDQLMSAVMRIESKVNNLAIGSVQTGETKPAKFRLDPKRGYVQE